MARRIRSHSLAHAGEGSSAALSNGPAGGRQPRSRFSGAWREPRDAAQTRRHLSDMMAAKPVALLAEKGMRTWRNGIVKRDLKPVSADRVACVFKAALNLAASDDPRIINWNAWKNGSKQLPDGETARNVIPSDRIVGRALVRACCDDEYELGVFVEALAYARLS